MVAGSTLLSILAAVLFWACNAIQITQIAQQSSKWGSFDKSYYTQLNPDSIEFEWAEKYSARSLEYAAGFLKGAFWIVFSLPVVEMAWVLSKKGTRSLGCNIGIAVFALAGSWSKWFTAIFWNGIYISFIQLSRNFNLDDWLSTTLANQFDLDGEDGIGWRVLQVNYLVTRGLPVVVAAVEWLCLTVIFTLSFFSVMEWRKEDLSSFGGKWNALGLFIGILCLVQFILEIVGVEGQGLAWIFFILYSALVRLILVPTWIIILGFQLPRATSKEFDSINQLELSENQQQTKDNDEFQDALQPPSGPSSPPAEAFASAGSFEDVIVDQ